MIEGPYQSNRWQERFLKAEGILLVLQLVALLAVAVVFGYSWLASGQYVKVVTIFGSGVALAVLALKTRAPIFTFALVIPVVAAWFWP
jgi:hypothetical protein